MVLNTKLEKFNILFQQEKRVVGTEKVLVEF